MSRGRVSCASADPEGHVPVPPGFGWMDADKELCRSPADITKRLNRLIADIRSRWHAPVIGTKENVPKDVLIVAHGHILRAFAMLWVGKAIEDGPSMLLEAGGVGTLR